MKLADQEKQKIIELIKAGKSLPAIYKSKLFDSEDVEFIEATKDYKLVYKGKARKEDIIAGTPSAPLQKVRSFNSDNPFDDGWHNMLIFGDNLLALKALYDDQRGANIYKTKNRIKLIYIDPPFATKQDFMKDREKAYRDKIIGTHFIEFLRKRLILLREILADDGCIYVHLDQKKGHYIKTILDELFGEHNFQNEITWKRTPFAGSSKARSNKFPINHDLLFFYSKSSDYFFTQQYTEYSEKYKSRFKYQDENGFYRKTLLKTYSKETEKKLKEENRFIPPEKPGAYPSYKQYLHESKGKQTEDIWIDINLTNPMAVERLNYPTQKPEDLLKRIILASSKNGDIVLDAFPGSGTTIAVAEKLSRRWIGIDCGKLAIYTMQKRMLNLTTQIGSEKGDSRRDYERVLDFEEHSKSNSRGLFFIYEKAKRGNFIVNDSFLKYLAEFIEKHLSSPGEESFSLVCPKSKFKVTGLKVQNNENGEAGEKIVTVGKVRFLISFIEPKEKPEKEQPLHAKEFTLYNAGIYDNKRILEMDWDHYKPFVMQLFGVRPEEHKIHGHMADGFIGVHSAYIWNYPEQKNLVLDREYVTTLHQVLGGKAGAKFYVVAPILSMGFMEDEIKLDDTTYVFLKVPLSVLMALIEKGEPGSLKQPVSENDVNEVIDAVGFDFVSQPVVKAKYFRDLPTELTLEKQGQKDFVIEITEFKSNTLVYDPEDFENFETLSMVLVDTNYNDDYFNLDHVFWADKILDKENNNAVIRIAETNFTGEKMMVIFMDKYGNELKVIRTKADFS